MEVMKTSHRKGAPVNYPFLHTNLISKTAGDLLSLAYLQLLDSKSCNYNSTTEHCSGLSQPIKDNTFGWINWGWTWWALSLSDAPSSAPTHGKPSLRFHFISLPFYWAFVFSLLQQINTGLKGFPMAPDSDGVLPQPPIPYPQKKKKNYWKR